MTVLSADFEAGVNGNTITTGDTGSATAWNDVTVGTSCTATYSNTHAHGGTLAAKLLTGASGDQSRLGWTTALAAATSTGFYFRWYVYMTVAPTAAYDLARIETAIGRAANLALNIDRTVEIRGDAGVIGTSTTPLVLNSWNRIECHLVTGASGTFEVKLFTGTNADAVSPDQTLPFTTSTSSGDITKFYIGNGTGAGHGNSNQSIWLDDIKLDTAAYPGPSVAPSASHYAIVAATETDTAAVLDVGSPTLGHSGGTSGPDALVFQQLFVSGEAANQGFTATRSGAITSITANLHGPLAGTALVRACVYSDVAGSPSTLLCYTDTRTFTSVHTDDDYEFTGLHGTTTITAGSRYWIGLYEAFNTSDGVRFHYTAGASGISKYRSAVADPPPATFPAPQTSSIEQLNIWFSYTAAAAAAYSITPADETDEALVLVVGTTRMPKIAASGLVYLFGDSGTAHDLGAAATETDSAVALTTSHSRQFTITPATSSSTALPLSVTSTSHYTLTAVDETDTAVALDITHTVALASLALSLPLGYTEAPDLYGRIIVSDLPASYWRLDGDYVDVIGLVDLTPVGAPSAAAPLISYGAAMYLAGTDALTATSTDDYALGDTFTLECWFTPDPPPVGVGGGFGDSEWGDVEWGNPFGSGGGDDDWTLFSKGTNGYQLQMSASGLHLLKEDDGIIISSTGFAPTADTSYHIVATKDGPDSAALYVNGVDVSDIASYADRTCTDTLVDLNIGRKSDDTEHAVGTFDELAVYPYPITADMVQMHYLAGSDVFGVKHFDSDEYPAMAVEIAFDSPWNDPYPRWENVTEDLRVAGLTINASGRADETQRSSPAAAQILLDNRGRDFDPTNTAGEYGDRVLPMRQTRIRFAWDTMYWGFKGWADDWTVNEISMGFDSTTTINCVDMFQAFANFEFDSANTLLVEQLAGARIEACCDLLGIPDNQRNIDAGLSSMPQLERPTGKIIDHILAVADSDGGFLYVGLDGRLVYEGRRSRVAMPVFATFGDTSPELPYSGIERSSNTAYMFNRAVVTPGDGNDEAVAEDAPSLAEHPPLTYTKTVLTGFNEAQAAAEWYVARYKDPAVRFLSVDLTGAADPDLLWATVLGTVNSLRYRFRRRPLGGGTMELDEYVERISHKISASGWIVSWSLSPFGDEDLWPLDDADFLLATNTYPTW